MVPPVSPPVSLPMGSASLSPAGASRAKPLEKPEGRIVAAAHASQPPGQEQSWRELAS